MVTMERIWVVDDVENMVVQVDFSNDRHHLIKIPKPCGVNKVVAALHELADQIESDEELG